MKEGNSTQPAEARLDSVSNRAKELWEKAGRPEGRDLEFWLAAEKEWTARESSSRSDTKAASPAPRAERPKSDGKEKRSPKQENL